YACSSDDSLAPGSDGGTIETDGSLGGKDGSLSGSDSGSHSDASTPKDSGSETDSSVPPDPTSTQIAAVKAAAVVDAGAGADGGLVLSTPLSIDDAFVTFVRPAVGTDPAGFFLQSQQTGPAIFVAVDPSTLSPAPAAGDKVSLKATAVANVAGLHEIVALSNWARSSTGNDVTGLLRDVTSANDLSTKIDNYESEYIKVTGIVAAPFASNGTDYVAATFTSMGITTGTTTVRLRIPTALQTAIDPAVGCQFTMKGVMWRFNTGAEPSVFDASQIMLTCGAPQLASAQATSATTVNVTFNRFIDATTAIAGNFTFDGSLTTASVAATADPMTFAVTTNEAQTPGTTYHVTGAAGIKDVLGVALDSAHNQAAFTGFKPLAVLQLNELNPNLGSSSAPRDLVELYVVSGGDIGGIQLQENLVESTVKLATLPSLQVATGDYIVVHLGDLAADGGPNFVNETTDKTACTATECYAGAWDVIDTKLAKVGLTYSGRIVVVMKADGTLQDGLSWFRFGSATTKDFYMETNALIDAGMWSNCGATQYCSDSDAAAGVSVNNNDAGATADGQSTQRIGTTNNHNAADWTGKAGTFGAAN
ncbi:MAG TPA: Ig-like domain-containing protein, partial [Polyangiaceae bacterium]